MGQYYKTRCVIVTEVRYSNVEISVKLSPIPSIRQHFGVVVSKVYTSWQLKE